MNGDARDSPTRRRHARKGDLAEERILLGAERLLADRPLSAITVDELASGAGISRPTFYFYFASREAVLLALAQRILDDLYGAAESWLRRAPDEPPAVAVGRAVEATLALWRRHGPVLRAAVLARETVPEMRSFWDHVGRRFVDATAAHIERERVGGAAPPGPPDARVLAGVLVAMNEQACYTASLRRRAAAADRRLVEALTTVWVRAVYGAT